MKLNLRIKSTIIALLLGIILQSSAFGQTVIDGFFYSASLGQMKMVDIYLPPGYDANPDLHYPVMYYLHGWGGNQNFLSTISSYATSKINNGEIDPMIIVCASNYTAPFDGSMYMNSEVHGDYEDYMINDLISWLDATYRTVPAKEYRTVMGHSMGGYGAFRYGTMHKDKFCGLASHAAPANLEVIINQFKTQIKSENSGPPYSYNYGATGNFTKMIFLGAGVWSPNLNTTQSYITPQVVEYPFDQQANVIDTIFDKWDQHQVTSLVHNLSPSDDMGILFGCGSSDELFFDIANDALKDTLDALSLDYEFLGHTGGHVLPTVFKNRALVFLDSLMLPPTTLEEPCVDPSNLMADNITNNSVDLSWIENGDATTWEIVIDVSGFDPDNGTAISVTDNPISWSGLSPETSYDCYIRSDCGDSNYSNWVGPNSFSTTEEIITQTIELLAGWNIHSFMVSPDTMDMLNIHSDLINSNQLLKIIDESGNFIQYFEGYGWWNSIGDMQLGEGYYMKVDTTTEIQISGELVTTSCEIPLSNGWNILGYPLAEGQDAMLSIQPLIDANLLTKVIDESGGFIQEIPGLGWLNTIGNFVPGEGYYIKVNANTSLTLNCPMTSSMLTQNEVAPEAVLFDKSFTANPYNPMNIIVQDIDIKGIRILEGDEVGVFDNDICVGAAVITYEDGNMITNIVAAMDDPTTEAIDGYTEGNELSFKYMNSDLEYPIEIYAEDIAGSKQFKSLGTYVTKLSYQVLAVEENESTQLEINTYPNPVDQQMNIAYNIPQGQVYMAIINLNGSRVENVMSEFHEEGNHTKTLNVSNLKQGFYVLQIRVITKGEIYDEFHKFVKL